MGFHLQLQFKMQSLTRLQLLRCSHALSQGGLGRHEARDACAHWPLMGDRCVNPVNPLDRLPSMPSGSTFCEGFGGVYDCAGSADCDGRGADWAPEFDAPGFDALPRG